MKKNNKVTTIIGIIITVIALAFSAYIIINGTKDAEFTLDETTNTLDISAGIYSKTIEIDENVEISLISPLTILRRTNGSSIGNVKQGYFTIEGDLAVYLSLGDSTQNWIEIIDGEDYYYINLKSPTETTALYNQLEDLFN